ncbi:hypothetical protein VNI00_004037 [Paramarasmius palmivorus]|uniref:DUF7770 domain-containing protein n=1 Tax=Paramarasmius palmivorus TaxID=297713 RepID=A0AAW0DQ76_9AGAR
MSLYIPPARSSIFLDRGVKSCLAELMALHVMSVRIISASQGDDTNPDPNQVQVYHAKLYLELLGTEKRVLCFDPTPGAFMQGNRFWGVIMISECASAQATINPETSVEFVQELTDGPTAAELFEKLFDEEEMDKYLFTEGGTGCRHWCITAIEKMIEWKYLPLKVKKEIEEWEYETHSKLGAKFPLPRLCGDFHKRSAPPLAE